MRPIRFTLRDTRFPISVWPWWTMTAWFQQRTPQSWAISKNHQKSNMYPMYFIRFAYENVFICALNYVYSLEMNSVFNVPYCTFLFNKSPQFQPWSRVRIFYILKNHCLCTGYIVCFSNLVHANTDIATFCGVPCKNLNKFLQNLMIITNLDITN